MHFSTDQQTLNDLMVFGKPGANSILSLFNKTLTSGGAEKLADMFRYPMADFEGINTRSKIIQYFAVKKLAFPFQPALFDVIEQYLSNTDERSKLQPRESSVSEKLKGLVVADPHTKSINDGVTALRQLLADLQRFFADPDFGQNTGTDGQHPYSAEVQPMQALLQDADLNGFMEENAGKTLSYTAVAGYDVLLRFKKRDKIRSCLQAIYQLDVYLSVAGIAVQRGFCYPDAMPAERGEVVFEGVYHPFVKGAVANSLRIDPQGNVIFLTGANMAGKSTLMKSLGTAMYLAHMGFPVPAKAMSFSVREGIYTSINLPDNLGRGMSHFYAEVLRIKKVSQELGQNKHLFIIIDELFRGTNVKDAYEATVAITSAFAAKRNCMFVMSTHIMEAGDTLKQRCNNINFVYLPTKMDGKLPVYTYRLEKGITADRHGMIIINNEGILDILNKKLSI